MWLVPGQVVKQAQPLGTVATHAADVTATALKMDPAGLFITCVVGPASTATLWLIAAPPLGWSARLVAGG